MQNKKSRFYLMLLFTFVVLACVTVNVYFPEAAVQEAADKFVERVKKGTPASKENKQEKGKDGSSLWFPSLIATAEAQERNIRTDFPEIRAAEARLRASYQQLLPHLNSGAVTEGEDGYLKQRGLEPRLLGVFNQHNELRKQVYMRILQLNGLPTSEMSRVGRIFGRSWRK